MSKLVRMKDVREWVKYMTLRESGYQPQPTLPAMRPGNVGMVISSDSLMPRGMPLGWYGMDCVRDDELGYVYPVYGGVWLMETGKSVRFKYLSGDISVVSGDRPVFHDHLYCYEVLKSWFSHGKLYQWIYASCATMSTVRLYSPYDVNRLNYREKSSEDAFEAIQWEINNVGVWPW